MGSNKVVIGGLLVALALVGYASAADELKCATPSDKGECKHDVKMGQYLRVQCPSGGSFEPANAFENVDNDVCKDSVEIGGTCTNKSPLKTLVPGAEITYPEGDSKKYDFKIKNGKELSSDTMVYASCKNGDGSAGFKISIKFLKGTGSDASSRATMPAVLLGALTTLAVMLRA